MTYSNDQLILAAHTRTLALEFWLDQRNALHDAWHASHPGETRAMEAFANDLNAKSSFNEFIIQAHKELERIAKITLQGLSKEQGQSQTT